MYWSCGTSLYALQIGLSPLILNFDQRPYSQLWPPSTTQNSILKICPSPTATHTHQYQALIFYIYIRVAPPIESILHPQHGDNSSSASPSSSFQRHSSSLVADQTSLPSSTATPCSSDIPCQNCHPLKYFMLRNRWESSPEFVRRPSERLSSPISAVARRQDARVRSLTRKLGTKDFRIRVRK